MNRILQILIHETKNNEAYTSCLHSEHSLQVCDPPMISATLFQSFLTGSSKSGSNYTTNTL